MKTDNNDLFKVHFIFIDRESQYLVGFVLRRDLLLALDNARARLDTLPTETLCVFTHHVPVVGSGPPPLKLRKIVDLAPITITDQVSQLDVERSSCSFLSLVLSVVFGVHTCSPSYSNFFFLTLIRPLDKTSWEVCWVPVLKRRVGKNKLIRKELPKFA